MVFTIAVFVMFEIYMQTDWQLWIEEPVIVIFRSDIVSNTLKAGLSYCPPYENWTPCKTTAPDRIHFPSSKAWTSNDPP